MPDTPESKNPNDFQESLSTESASTPGSDIDDPFLLDLDADGGLPVFNDQSLLDPPEFQLAEPSLETLSDFEKELTPLAQDLSPPQGPDIQHDLAQEPQHTREITSLDTNPASQSQIPTVSLSPVSVQETQPISAAPIAAEFPWSLRITGILSSTHKERLKELINDHKMGITEFDLEPQFEAARVLIPRVSEFAAILLVRAIRSTQAHIELLPSNGLGLESLAHSEIQHQNQLGTQSPTRSHENGTNRHPADQIPCTQDAFLNAHIIDTLTASLAITSQVVHDRESKKLQEAIETLKRELKYKAYYRGATRLTQFAVQLIPLSPLTHYRAVVMATAIKEN